MDSAPRPQGKQSPAATAQVQLRVWLRLLTNTNLVLGRLRRALLDEFGVTMPVFDLLAQIHRPPQGPTMGELSHRLMVSKGNLSDLVERVEAKGLIERRPDPDDGRVHHVYLTAAGEQLTARLLPAHEAWLKQMMSGMDEDFLSELGRSLGVFKATLVANTSDVARPARRRSTKRTAESDR